MLEFTLPNLVYDFHVAQGNFRVVQNTRIHTHTYIYIERNMIILKHTIL